MDNCCQYFNLNKFKSKFHDVKYDAEMTAKLIVNLLKMNEGTELQNLRLSNIQIKNSNKQEDSKNIKDELFIPLKQKISFLIIKFYFY